MFKRVIVSTEDGEIKRAALNSGAEVLDRPKELAQDRSTVIQVCKHVLDVLRKENFNPNFFCCIYATAIFITPDDIRNSFHLFHQKPSPDVVMGVSDFNLHPVQALEERFGFLNPKWPEYVGVQSQFQPRLVASNGTIYWARTKYFVQDPNFYCKRLKGYAIPRIRAIDIDTPEDLEFARIVAEKTLRN